MPGLLTAKELRAERRELHETYQSVLDAAASEERELNTEEREKLDRIDEKDDQLKADIERIERHEARTREMEQSEGRRTAETKEAVTEPPAGEERQEPEDRERPQVTEEFRDRVNAAMRNWTLNQSSGEDLQTLREAGFSLTRGGREIHLNLWDTKRSDRWRRVEPHERRSRVDEMRAQSTTDAEGGYTIPEELVAMIETALLDFGGMRESGANVIRTASGEKMTIPTADDTGNAGSLLAENTQVSEQDITFAEKQLDAYKYSSDLIRVSNELLTDAAVDIPSFLGSALGERIGRITNTHFTTGTGTNQPNGVVTAATSAATTAGATTVTYDELQTLVHSVDPAYRRQGARFMVSDQTLKVLKQMKDGQGRPLWVPGLAVREPDTLAGYPYTVNQDVADIAASAKAILFGAFRYYWIRDIQGLRLLRLEERYADFDQIGWVAFSRHDGELVSAGAPIKFLTQSA